MLLIAVLGVLAVVTTTTILRTGPFHSWAAMGSRRYRTVPYSLDLDICHAGVCAMDMRGG
jgi:hypothetical protein